MADKIYIVRKDKLLAGYNGNLESVIVHDSKGEKPVEITNGMFVVVEGLMEGKGRETKKARLAGSADSAKDVLFIHNAEVMYDERQSKLEDFRIKAGKVARAYRLYDGDIITMTTDLFKGDVKVGDVLSVQADGMIGKGTDAGSAKVVFTVIEDCGYQLHNTAGSFAVQVSRN